VPLYISEKVSYEDTSDFFFNAIFVKDFYLKLFLKVSAYNFFLSLALEAKQEEREREQRTWCFQKCPQKNKKVTGILTGRTI